MDDDYGSDNDLVIDESLILDEEDQDEKLVPNKMILTKRQFHETEIEVTNHELMISENVFDTSMDIVPKKEILYTRKSSTVSSNQDEYNCETCGESFKYYVGFISHTTTKNCQNNSIPTITAVQESQQSEIKRRKKVTVRKPRSISSSKTEIKITCQSDQPLNLSKDGCQEGLAMLERLQNGGIIVTNISSKSEESTREKISINTKGRKLYSCIVCKKTFVDENKLTQHNKQVLQFKCMFCNTRFCWESKYKKHLHKTHKLNAVIVCKYCSQVFSDMTELSYHTTLCEAIKK